ncbi:hypothetical protein ACOXXX_18360 [Thalassococcus sp. BH17M4-6]|uniref:hypothetical protein n=1 Tax=Thalassococcus sp. BH17M4-6 TaxID=3413148 RepID=UPI003BD68C96
MPPLPLSRAAVLACLLAAPAPALAQVLEPASDATIRNNLCVGQDCADDPTPSFLDDFASALLLYDTRVRIDTIDASTGVTFPSADWSLLFNDTASFANGGIDHFSVQNRSTNTVPFRIEGGAPTAALHIDATGRIGLNTTIPQTDLDIFGGTTADLRLSANIATGAPSIFDLRADASGLVLRNAAADRDVLQVTQTAPGGALFIGETYMSLNSGVNDYDIIFGRADGAALLFADAGTGDIGIGTTAPAAGLHMLSNDGDAGIRVENSPGAPVAAREMFAMVNNGGSYFTLDNTASGTTWYFTHEQAAPNRFIIADAVADGPEMSLSADGILTVPGGFVVGSTTLNVPDYVFGPDYALKPLSEVAAFIADNRHLPGVPSAATIAEDGLDVAGMQMAMLRKIEELTLYTLEQDAEIARLRRLEARLRQVEAALAAR